MPYGQAAVLGVVPGAWLTGISAVGDEPTPVHTMTEYVELVDSFLGEGVYRCYIMTVRVSKLISLPSFSHCPLPLSIPLPNFDPTAPKSVGQPQEICFRVLFLIYSTLTRGIETASIVGT